MKIAIVVGEASGDILGAGLIAAIKSNYPDAQFIGVTGPLMQAEGCHSVSSYDPLAVFGIFEIISDLPKLFRFRADLVKYFLSEKPDVFIGIDAPDFNLGLEKSLRENGVKTMHYVSPSVWAWRKGRIKKIKRCVDHMLTLLPFEAEFYREAALPVTFVGHPMADDIEFDANPDSAKQQLGLPMDKRIVAVLPGSRSGEVNRLSECFFGAMFEIHQQCPETHFVIPVARPKLRAKLSELQSRFSSLPVTLVDGSSREVLIACECVLLASGTASLEAMLCGKPMVMAYKIAPLTYWLVKFLRLMNITVFSLPNLLDQQQTVEEFIQQDVTVPNLSAAMLSLLQDGDRQAKIKAIYREIHQQLRRDASVVAAQQVMELANSEST